jgi:hypothetical protein
MKIRSVAVILFTSVGLSILMSPPAVWSQLQPLSLGTVTGVTPITCPSGYNSGTVCYTATVENCSGALNLGFTYGELGTGSSGTIVTFNGGAGDTTPEGSPSFATDYSNAGYKVVQVVWSGPWEDTADGSGVSIKTAGCRPATVLKYVYQNIYTNSSGTAGMCAQGTSAGSGAIGYALAEYGSGAYLDNVELLSGPVFGDIEKGCVVPNTPTVTVCPAGVTACNTGTEGGWPDPPQYIDGDITAINNWSGIDACNGSSNTTSAENAAWKHMSIVDGLSDSTLSYPNTAVAGWLCSNTSVSCGGAGNPCQNNSAAEGQYFYSAITADKQLEVYRVDECTGAEGVTGTSAHLPPPKASTSGYTAILDDMLNNCHH